VGIPGTEESAVTGSFARRFAVCVLGLCAAAAPASAQEPNCVTVCQQKVDACGARCEALADAVYRDPASLKQCQLGCAQQLFVSCVEHCNETGEVVADDYGIVAEHPDHLPAPPDDQK
jgi:hypothetical protein